MLYVFKGKIFICTQDFTKMSLMTQNYDDSSMISIALNLNRQCDGSMKSKNFIVITIQIFIWEFFFSILRFFKFTYLFDYLRTTNKKNESFVHSFFVDFYIKISL